MKKSETRNLAEKIQAKNGKSLISIQLIAAQMVEAGMAKTRKEALEYMLEIES